MVVRDSDVVDVVPTSSDSEKLVLGVSANDVVSTAGPVDGEANPEGEDVVDVDIDVSEVSDGDPPDTGPQATTTSKQKKIRPHVPEPRHIQTP